MATSGVECQGCGSSSEAIEWGFVLLARHGWTAQLIESGQEPLWRCPDCSQRLESSWERELEVLDNAPGSQRGRARVLLVDDQQLVLRATAVMLREFDVVTANSGAQALERLTQGHFDVVVSDVTMPDMSGPEFFVQVCRYYPSLGSRFLFLSGDVYRSLPLIHHAAAVAGVDMPALLEKPVPRDALVREIQALADSRNIERSGTFVISGVASQRTRISK